MSAVAGKNPGELPPAGITRILFIQHHFLTPENGAGFTLFICLYV